MNGEDNLGRRTEQLWPDTVTERRCVGEVVKTSGSGQSWRSLKAQKFDPAELTLFSRNSRGDGKLRQWGEIGCQIFYSVFPPETRRVPTGGTCLFTTPSTLLIGEFLHCCFDSWYSEQINIPPLGSPFLSLLHKNVNCPPRLVWFTCREGEVSGWSCCLWQKHFHASCV